MAKSHIRNLNTAKFKNLIDSSVNHTVVITNSGKNASVNGYSISQDKRGFKSYDQYFHLKSSAVGYALCKQNNIRNIPIEIYDRLIQKYDQDIFWYTRSLKRKNLTYDQKIYFKNRLSQDIDKLRAYKTLLRQTLKSIKVA